MGVGWRLLQCILRISSRAGVSFRQRHASHKRWASQAAPSKPLHSAPSPAGGRGPG
ncbi:hypothetical protein LC55x_0628 [Lysobacter capsici]|nr:hypothetical protein LC55x_0628 [Lysobacter capsici]